MADADEVRRAGVLMERLVELALSMDGTCTGEHGVGQGKMKYLLAEHGAPALARHGGDQARARPAKHHESRQDRRAYINTDIDLPPNAGKNGVHFIPMSAERASADACTTRAGVGVADHFAWLGDRDHSGAAGGAGRSVADRLGHPPLAVRGGGKPPDRRRGARHRRHRGAAFADALAHAARHRDRRRRQQDPRAQARLRIRARAADARRVAGGRNASGRAAAQPRARRHPAMCWRPTSRSSSARTICRSTA